MKRWAFVVVMACGGSHPQTKPPPIENTAPAEPAFEPTAAPGEIRVVQRGSTGGVIELDGDRGKAMEAANKEMINVCGIDHYVITQEGEEFVGMPGPTQGAHPVWRVHYQCAP